jgi:phosphoribosylanthranilate isomerase
MPSGPGVIPEPLIAAIAIGVPPGTATFLLTALTDTVAIIAQHRRCRTTAIQLVDALTHGTHADLRCALPGVQLVQVIHVTGEDSVARAVTAAPEVDFILLDSGNPNLVVKELGGTGRTHNWGISRRIVETCGRPVFLAGGLRPENLATAYGRVRPYGFDLCNGVRTAEVLDGARLAACFAAVRALK